MKTTRQVRQLDKIYKRRNRYEIPSYQREEVWPEERKRELIDSILRGWRLPKFYFLKLAEDQYEVVDGQQRLSAIYEFFGNQLRLSEDSARRFGGSFLKDLPPKYSDAFDDFEIDYDEIEDATPEEMKLFFQRLQQGMPLTSSENLNAVHSKLRDFCKSELARHKFFTQTLALPDVRFAHFDIAIKAAAIELEGLECGLRYDDLKEVLEAHARFSPTLPVGKRLKSALDFLAGAFPEKESLLKSRAVIQSLITVTCLITSSGRAKKKVQAAFATFVRQFLQDLTTQVELGQAATDNDLIRFQRTLSANTRIGPSIRHEVLLRRALASSRELTVVFTPDEVLLAGVHRRVAELADAIADHVTRINTAHAATYGEDLFKVSTKANAAMKQIRHPITTLEAYKQFITALYIVFHESHEQRLAGEVPTSFDDVRLLRHDQQHDLSLGNATKAQAKRANAGRVYQKYANEPAPEETDPVRLVLVQANVLTAIETDLIAM